MTGRDDTSQHDLTRVPDPAVVFILSVAEAGRFLGLCRATSYEHARTGTFPVPVFKTGRKLSVPTAALRRYLHLDVD